METNEQKKTLTLTEAEAEMLKEMLDTTRKAYYALWDEACAKGLISIGDGYAERYPEIANMLADARNLLSL